MKSVRSLIGVLSLFLIFIFFFACSAVSSKDADAAGEVSFVFNPTALKSSVDSSRTVAAVGSAVNSSVESSEIERDNISYRFDVSLKGGYSSSKTIIWTGEEFESAKKGNSLAAVKFDGIPIGKKLYAEVVLYKIHKEQKSDEKSVGELLMKGSSDAIRVTEGEQLLTLSNFCTYYDFPFTISINLKDFDFFNENELNSLAKGLYFYAFSADSEFVRFMQTAELKSKSSKNDAFTYEIASKINEYTSLSTIFCSSGSNNYVIDAAARKLTVTGSINLPVNENSAGRQDKIVFFAVSWNGSKLKCLGCLDELESVSPSKSGNFVSMSLHPLHISDTDFALYDFSDGAYNFYINSSLNGAVGSADFTNCAGSFVFDSNGNFYALKKNAASFSIVSNKSGFGEVQTGITVGDCPAPVLFIDKKSDEMYIAKNKGASESCIIKYPNLVSSGSVESAVEYRFSFSGASAGKYSLNAGSPATMYNGVLYMAGSNSETSAADKSDSVFAINFKGAAKNGSVYKLTNFERIDLNLKELDSQRIAVNDIHYQNDCLFLLVNESSSAANTTNSRGAILKYSLSAKSVTAIKGWASGTTRDTFACRYVNSFVYKEMSSDSYYAVSFPEYAYTFNAPFNDERLFVGPQKFIAVKPSKLAVADSGVAFYTDESGVVFKKKVNRVVELDFEALSLEKAVINDVKLEFSNYYPDVFISDAKGVKKSFETEEGYTISGEEFFPISIGSVTLLPVVIEK